MTNLPIAIRTLVGVGCATLLVGCGNLFRSDCVSIGVAGIEVSVVPAPSADPLASTPRVTIQEGTYEEQAAMSANSPPPLRFRGAIERPGTYTVIVEADGYVTQRVENVQVGRSGDCNYLDAARFTVTLVRAP